MNEAEWPACNDRIGDLFDCVQQLSPALLSRRKIGLTVVAWANQIGRLLYNDLTIRAFQLLERGIEGAAILPDVVAMRLEMACGVPWNAATAPWTIGILWPDENSDEPAVEAVYISHSIAQYISRTEQSDLLRDIFGNPFRPVTADPTWLTSTVVALARGIYADRAFDRLPILADALQDAGCDHADVLAHCRGPGPHARRCWVVDLVLGLS